jgi:hypothetical protein
MNAINAARLLFAALFALVFGDRQRVQYEWRHTQRVARVWLAIGFTLLFGGIFCILFAPAVWEAMNYIFSLTTN